MRAEPLGTRVLGLVGSAVYELVTGSWDACCVFAASKCLIPRTFCLEDRLATCVLLALKGF